MSEKKVPVKLKFSAAAASMLNSHDYYSEPLIKMPLFDALPKPEKYESGTEIAKAQGHETTKNIKPL